MNLRSLARHRRMKRSVSSSVATLEYHTVPSHTPMSTTSIGTRTLSTPIGAGGLSASTAASAMAKHHNNKRPPPIIIYPTVSPESIVVPIVSCIFGFPLLALTVICCLRRRAKLARERARRRNCELDRGELSVVRVSPARRQRAVSLVRSPRPLPALELDTVVEEKSDPEQTQVEMMTPDREVSAMMAERADDERAS